MGRIGAKKNILIFSHSSSLGGAERSMINLVDILLNQGFSALIVLPGRGPIEKELRRMSIPFLVVRYCWWAWPEKITAGQYLQSIHNVVSYLPRFVKFKPSCIITITAVIPWGMMTAQLLNVPHIWNITEFVEKDHGLIPEITFPELAKIIYLGSERIWFVSKAVQEEFEKYIPHNKSKVIHSQVDVPKLLAEEKIESPYKYADSFKIIMSSNVYPTKGQDQAIKAVRILIDKNYDVELLLIGRKRNENMKYFEKLIKFIGTKYKNRIYISRFFNNPYPIILMSDLVLVCSRSEAFSRIMIESGLLGKTFVASNTGGNMEVDRKNGLFYEYGNSVDLANKIEYFIKNPGVFKKMSIDHQKHMQVNFQRNPNFIGVIPRQLKAVKKEATLVNTFGLVRKVLEKYHERGSYQTIKILSAELKAIKSSKNYRLWKKYHRVRDSIKGTLKLNE